MKDQIRKLSLLAGGVNQHHVRLILVLLSLILFVLGAGAPAGDVGPGSGS
jgi:hypothetical protein